MQSQTRIRCRRRLNNLPIRARLALLDCLLGEQDVGRFSRAKPALYRLLPGFTLVSAAIATMRCVLYEDQEVIQSACMASNTLPGLRRNARRGLSRLENERAAKAAIATIRKQLWARAGAASRTGELFTFDDLLLFIV